MSLKIIENILHHPHDTRMWDINITGEEFVGKLWQFDAGKALMKVQYLFTREIIPSMLITVST